MMRFFRRHRFGILVTALVGVFLSYGGLSSCISFRAKVSEYNYYLIDKGMSLAEVEAILGPGRELNRGVRIWWGDECVIILAFDEDGKVSHMHKSEGLRKPPRIPRLP
jgi:hypothetical protein